MAVFVPETTTERAKSLIRQEGAEVFVHGASWHEANERALKPVDADTAFIHPFDDPILWTGHATMIDEVVRAGAAFDAVVLSVGRGGLLSGVADRLARNGLQDIPIIAAETDARRVCQPR
ncbi:pyridoxal-phosphate dependent enzyme [Sinorhizobium fredii]|uniref:pyridoxal-phosphate dependent enzyme n=1 Tax=Rhizobium fredii TaxID=380 RepID=UPI0006847FB4|nr:pyridoxal-phosphate dependent enzyme [Sinorhizobium fredii]